MSGRRRLAFVGAVQASEVALRAILSLEETEAVVVLTEENRARSTPTNVT